MRFSTEELDFFTDIFTEGSPDTLGSESNFQTIESDKNLSVQTEVPVHLKQVLADSKLTLLAEISHYQLWFPVSLSFSENGTFLPKLGTPEIIDVNGNDRSWRVDTPENVEITDVFNGQGVEVLSLSATGVTFKVADSSTDNNDLDWHNSSFEMSLAGGAPLKLELDLVRHEKDLVAAKFKNLQEGRECLRKFLFNSHKVKYSNLYQDVIL